MKEELDLSLYLVTDRPLSLGRDIAWIVSEAVKGGATIVQLREKDCNTREFVELAVRLKKELAPLGVPLIINDRIDVALASDADGVHIGQSDMPYAMARELMGPNKIIGLSVENMSQVEEANELDVDYIGISPVFSTETKLDTSKPFGVSGTQRAVALSRHASVAIGGMNVKTIPQVMQSGVDGVAVVSAIVSAEEPYKAARELRQLVEESRPSWSKVAWQSVGLVFHAIVNQPFNVELMQGTLATEKFVRYLQQDQIYIKNYGEEMYLLAEMLPQESMRELFRRFAHDGIEAEKGLHAMLVELFKINSMVSASAVTEEYMAFTRQYVERDDLLMSMAAMLPCMWVYNEIGLYIHTHSQLEGNPYSDWIEMYASDLMTEGVLQTVKMCDELAGSASLPMRAAMRYAFVRATELEWMFWEYGYTGEYQSFSRGLSE